MKERLLTKEDLYNLGVQIMEEVLERNNERIINISPSPIDIPVIEIESINHEKAFVYLDVVLAPETVYLTTCKKYVYTRHAKENNRKGYYAAISIRNKNEEHQNNKTNYIDDEYISKIEDYKELKLEHLDDPLNDECRFKMLDWIGMAYNQLFYEMIECYLDDYCILEDNITNGVYCGKKAIEKYYRDFFSSISECRNNIDIALDEYDGSLDRNNDEQETSKPVLVLGYRKDNLYHSKLLDVDFNEIGKITKIQLKDPRVCKTKMIKL